jgi:predicted N-acetyltransferase YhbS
VARSVTDFNYCCYLSDLAVDLEYQKRGIGRGLIAETQKALGPRCGIILLSAPAAVQYYPHIGFQHHPQAWILPRSQGV